MLIFLASLVILGRLFITPRLDLPTFEGSYEAFAHLFVGYLFGVAFFYYKFDKKLKNNPPLWIGVILSVFELLMFLYQKYIV